MKKIFFLFSVLLINYCYSQIPVTDAAANANLVYLNTQIATLNSNLATLNSTASSQKVEAVNTQKNTLDQLGLSKDQESLLWKVPGYLKQGMEIKNILKKENQVIQSISQINSSLNSSGISGEERSNIMSQAYSLLQSTGQIVDMAVSLMSDNSYRMDNNERRNYLKDIDNTLSSVLGMVNSLKGSANAAAAASKSSSSFKNNANKVLQKINVKN
ncbi:hypothetical protein [Chryseobacterium oncorhynchi]|uniref:Conjugal transfer protein n=1 Tax=Chryseobacterium oncorhynchi TaxID=741074 RepID=A0A316WI67_9FLAO|nr:hypothetical protein [Chryseobacterium oncorhynchi]PWN59976.1 hypothetical protein C1638_020630 [Chryseobacterium oncorhynchi]